MTKMLVETTGDFMFQDVGANQDVQPHRPSVVTPTAFINIKVKEKKIKILDEDYGDNATDAEYGAKWDAEQAAKAGKPAPKNDAPPRSENKEPVQGKKEKDEDFAARKLVWEEAQTDPNKTS